jgi:hypothetical protein
MLIPKADRKLIHELVYPHTGHWYRAIELWVSHEIIRLDIELHPALHTSS